jgi:putative DNA primase/helicase
MLSEIDRANALIDEAVQAESNIVRMPGSAKAPAQAVPFELLTSAHLADLPPPQWAVRGVFPASGLAAVFGASGSGKTFLVLDLCLALAEGLPWFGHRTRTTFVTYAALEGEAGIRQRVKAWEVHRGRSMPDTMTFLLQPFQLTQPEDVKDLADTMVAAGGPGGVLVLDTLNRAAPTSDENSSKDMGELLQAAKRFQATTGGLVVLVHHSGKDATKGLRGHSSLFAALDAVIEVTRDGDRRRWSVAKSKDGEDGDGRVFRLTVVDLDRDDVGDLVTSCVVTSDTAAEEIKQVRLPKGGNQRIVYDALLPFFRKGRLACPGAPPLKPCIALQEATIEAAGHLPVDPDRRVERAKLAITGLVSSGVLGCNDGWIWLA